MIKVRELTPADAAEFRQLRARALREHPEWFGETYEDFLGRSLEEVAEWMTSANSATFGAFQNDQLVGIVRCSRRWIGPRDAHKAQITSVYVAPVARGKGTAKTLMLQAIQAARRWPEVEELRLAVVTENHSARQLYRSLGFHPYALEPRAMKIGDKYVDEEHMFLLLDERGPKSKGKPR